MPNRLKIAFHAMQRLLWGLFFFAAVDHLCIAESFTNTAGQSFAYNFDATSDVDGLSGLAILVTSASGTIDWGDGTQTTITSPTMNLTKVYTNAGTNQIVRTVNWSGQYFDLGFSGNYSLQDTVTVLPPPVPGIVYPKYLVLTVIYAPPGTDGGHSSSSVSYQASSTMGTMTSSSDSFQAGTTVSVDDSVGFLGNGGGVGVSFTYSQTSGDSQSLNITKTATSTITQVGPAQDGINHDQDEIWLLLNPAIDLTLTSSSAVWVFDTNITSTIQYLYVGWLNGDQPMPAGVASALQSAGITPEDYPDILTADPLAGGPPIPPSPRYVSANSPFAYEPPYAANDPVPTVTFSINNSSIATTGINYKEDNTVGLSISGNAGFLGLAKGTLKDTSTWTWTSQSSSSSSSTTSQIATLTVGGPAYGYAGSTVVNVYYDTLYGTFAFVIPPVAVPPNLTITASGTKVVLAWSTNTESAYSLQSAINLVSQGWGDVSIAPVIVNGSNTVTYPISGNQQFFRLSQ